MTSLAAMAEPSAAKADPSARVRIACRNLERGGFVFACRC